jgi:ubiquinone/menaquinone biosynthesis C-methylase UbiE
LGCGPGGVLHLLGKHVGPAGAVWGIDCRMGSPLRG